MKKLPYKILTLATLTTIITTSGIIPSQTFAKEQVVQQAATQEAKYELGPEGLKDALAQTGSYMLVMNLYAKTINAQSNIDLSGVELDAEGKGLLTTIHTNQKTARSNATFWLEK
ncbi:HBL/NHE enterotoxin family protein, partial [Bacillus thuringiensis]